MPQRGAVLATPLVAPERKSAAICAVDLKTVYHFQRAAAQRAKTHHQQVVRDVDVSGVQLDEAHSKLRPKQVERVHTALAMGSWFLLWGTFGPRTQDTAATLIAQVVARARQLPLFLTEWWGSPSPHFSCIRCTSVSGT